MKKLKSNLLTMLLVILVAFTLTACGSKATDETTEDVKVTEAITPEATPVTEEITPEAVVEEITLPTKDRAGNDITVPEEVVSIISLAPSATQILFDLGVGANIVAVDTQSPMYAEINTELLQLDIMTPDLEQIVALGPDIIFVTSMSNLDGEDAFKVARDAGICVAEIPSSASIDGVKEDIQFIADCVGKSTEGTVLIQDMETSLAEVATIGSTITDKKSVLFEIASAPSIYSFGSGVFLNEMIELIGAENAFAAEESWISVTEEAAIGANPDVILTNVNYIENPIDEIKNRVGWDNVTAVAENQVYYIDNGTSSLPNHNIVKALIEMAKAVYPEEYAGLN